MEVSIPGKINLYIESEPSCFVCLGTCLDMKTSLHHFINSYYRYLYDWNPIIGKMTFTLKRHPVLYIRLVKQRQVFLFHDDVIKWKHFPRYWQFVWGIHRSPVNSPHKGQWRRALIFFLLICTRINGWVNNGEAGDLRRYRAHYDVTVLCVMICPLWTLTNEDRRFADDVFKHVFLKWKYSYFTSNCCLLHWV